MKRREFLAIAGGTLATMAAGGEQAQGKRPNILWITCEDISPHLGCYGDRHANTPSLDRLAREGARYSNVFSVAGVCAPSRSCLITGMYQTTLGTHNMRCNTPPPPHVKCFPEYLRKAGYYCTNNKKTDYQFPVPKQAWDESSGRAHWRNRPNDAPFFAVFNLGITHESKVGTPAEKMERQMAVLPPSKRCEPGAPALPPYYPDSPVVREHWAHYYDLITIMDHQAGEILAQLEEDGLAEDTVVFFFSDHGVGLPRAKRWVYDSGIHVPFIVRWPGRVEANTVCDHLVSFVDFAPTVLSVAGLEPPEHMQGLPFMGSHTAAPRKYIYAARDRMDERYDCIRCVRDGRYKYIRNYEPERAYDQYLTYPEGFPVLQDMRRLQKAGELKGVEKQFFRQSKPVEELYDLEEDPHEVSNIVERLQLRPVLERMRKVHETWMMSTEDLGLVPEIEVHEWVRPGGKNRPTPEPETYEPLPAGAGKAQVAGHTMNEWIDDLQGDNPFARLRAIRSLGAAGSAARPIFMKALNDPDSAVAYWAGVGVGNLGAADRETLAALQDAVRSPSDSVRMGAAYALCAVGHYEMALPVLLRDLKNDNGLVRLKAVQILDEQAPPIKGTREALTGCLDDRFKYVARVAQHALDRLDNAVQ